MPAAPAKKAQAPARAARRPVVIEEVGAGDWAGGAGLIKAYILGGPDTGKSRWASAFPRPLYLACEPTVGSSIASRRIDYGTGSLRPPRVIRIHKADRPSDAMFDALDYLDEVPKKTRSGELPVVQTAILDTLDGLSRLYKDEWAAREGAATFTGRDAWSFLEGKLSLVLTRLLNLNMNVIVLCHIKDKELEEQVGEGTQKRTVYEPLLQGSIKDTIFNDFDLVGLMKKELVGDQEYRGISFDATPTYPFLKDHFALEAPGDRRLGRRFWPVVLEDGTKGGGDPQSFIDANYGLMASQLILGLDSVAEGGVIETLPDASAPSSQGVVPAGTPGGPVGTATPTPAAAPRKAVAQPVKAQPSQAAPAAATPPAAATSDAPASAAAASPQEAAPAASSAASTPTAPATPSPTETPSGASATPDATPEAVDPGVGGGDGTAAGGAEPQGAPVATESAADVAAPETPGPVSEAGSATDVPTTEEVVGTLQQELGAEVVAEGSTTDAPDAANTCPICGKGMEGENPDMVQLSRLKHRTLVLPDGRPFYDTGGSCLSCYQDLNKQKAEGSGLYAP